MKTNSYPRDTRRTGEKKSEELCGHLTEGKKKKKSVSHRKGKDKG